MTDEAAVKKGTAKCRGHAQIVHEIWLLAAKNKSHIWVERVPSEKNIADCPSRGEYALMRDLKAQWRKPVIAEMFAKARSSADFL